MKKRLFGIFAALCLCLTLLPTAALAVDPTVTTESDLRNAITGNTYDTINLSNDIELTAH